MVKSQANVLFKDSQLFSASNLPQSAPQQHWCACSHFTFSLFSQKWQCQQSHPVFSFLTDRCVFWIFYMKGISGLSFLSSFPPLIPVRKTLVVVPQAFFNLPVMWWKMWKGYFLSKTLMAICQLNPLQPLCVCVYICAHICSFACFYSLRLSTFKCVRSPMVVAMSFHGSVGFSACEPALLPATYAGYWWLELLHEVTATINCGWQTRNGTGEDHYTPL